MYPLPHIHLFKCLYFGVYIERESERAKVIHCFAIRSRASVTWKYVGIAILIPLLPFGFEEDLEEE